ncbi:MAG: energy-coupling factor transporter ATPase [Acidaminococcaceae bacterium]|nr:energy-coupling factor transporter ATPase [Acidaminococcaceae bacterium]MBQ8491343.1 energy-coupling factor transporter ATPase [Acidaminococcaceae bacterium]MBQ9255536.1 energy-coupling factor transporter ATPase [Acidaminococcaceae bacterium]MBQ9320296.1 energy-coupling factor transporter ATPase [Acidaminococcaceae bacterium]MBR1512256.1 energy-coupling factor transporter ATPase [Acidaminococcaceae bacterium]
MEPVIEVKGLKHIYTDSDNNRITALEQIDLQIMPGEFVAVIGANGSGKSTLARHLNALLLPTEGSVKINGMDTMEEDNLWMIRQQIGMVFQNPDNQIVAAIVEEDVAFGPENIGVPADEIRKRVDEALRIVDMEAYRTHAPHLLSGGQKQRVAIAGTLALGSECIVLDEPTAMLDPRGRREILATMKRLNKEKNITVVYITHFMTEAMEADRVVVMNKGKIAFQGTPAEVFSRVDELEKMGLEAPMASKFAFELKKSGAKLPKGIITNEGLAEALC